MKPQVLTLLLILGFMANAVAAGNLATKMPNEEEAGQYLPLFQKSLRQGPIDNSYRRDLTEYYGRRAYPGAPPSIPHATDESESAVSNCGSCHAFGGWVEKFQAYAPTTPHPDFLNCRQCHVRVLTTETFKKSDWVKIPPAKTGLAAIPGGPPPIPHRLQLRGTCISCHSGPSSLREIRTGHPERVNCRQCHIPRAVNNIFSRRQEAN